MIPQNAIKIIRGSITLATYKVIVNTLTLITILRQQNTPASRSPLIVYLTTNHELIWLAILAMLSFKYFIQNAHFKIIDGGRLTRMDYQWLKRTKLSLSIVTSEEERRTERLLRPYPYLHKYFQYGWSGKKFFIPLLSQARGKIINMDLDILFFRYPIELAAWANSTSEDNYFMHDYANFSVISTLEMKATAKQNRVISHLNSGLTSISLNNFWKHNSLRQLNEDIKNILTHVTDRMTYDYNTGNMLIYVYPLLEQTLYALSLNRGTTKPLLHTYYLFQFHQFLGHPIETPTCIHFTGEVSKRAMYRYLIGSFLKKVLDYLTGNIVSQKPWFIYSDVYCWRCPHKTATPAPHDRVLAST